MNRLQGFSLIEVLIALMLVSMTALGLLQQQWQSTQLFSQIGLEAQAIGELDNASELSRAYSNLKPSTHTPFELQFQTSDGSTVMQIRWQHLDKKRCLSRMLYGMVH